MVKLLKSLSLFYSLVNAAADHDWDYKLNGADWPEKYPTCGMKN